jgi:hypothetical protein
VTLYAGTRTIVYKRLSGISMATMVRIAGECRNVGQDWWYLGG